MFSRRSLSVFLILPLALPLVLLMRPSFAQAEGLRVEQAWARPNPPVVPNGAAYLIIHNDSTTERTLLSAASAVAQRIELHESLIENNMMSMRHRDQGIVIPAGATLHLEPGGLHIMLMGLIQPLKQGKSFALMLHFDDSETVAVTVSINEGPANGTVAD